MTRSGLTTALEDPQLVAVELDADAAAPEDRGRLLDAVERVQVVGEPLVGLGPAAPRSAATRAPGRCDQISSVTCGITGWRSFEQPLERGERRRARVRVAAVEPRLDRLGVPVAEVVERQVVERARRRRELELGDRVLELGPRGVEPGEDPPLLDVARPTLRLRVARRCRGSGARTFQSLFASFRPSSIAPGEKRTSCVEAIFSRP